MEELLYARSPLGDEDHLGFGIGGDTLVVKLEFYALEKDSPNIVVVAVVINGALDDGLVLDLGSECVEKGAIKVLECELFVLFVEHLVGNELLQSFGKVLSEHGETVMLQSGSHS